MISRTIVLALLVLTLSAVPASRVSGQNRGSQDRREILFLQQPDTPARLVRSADAAARLNRTQLARGYIQLVLDEAMPNEALLQLRDDVGVHSFLSLNAMADLQPMAGDLLRQVNAASLASMTAADQTASLIAQLGDNRLQAVAAGSALLTIGNPAAAALLTADTGSEAGTIAFNLLRQHPREFRYGILDALPDTNSEQTVRGLQVLAATADSELAPLLLEYEFSSDDHDVRQAASMAVDRLWSGDGRPRGSNEAVEWLMRQSATSLAEAADRFSSGSGESLRRATRLAQIAVIIDDSSGPAAAATMLACRAAASAVDVGADDAVRRAAINIALEAKHSGAVAALLNVDPVSLRRGMNLPGAVVRVTAAAELLKLNRTVRGTAFAQQVIRDAADGSTSPEAVVIDPRLDAATLATFLLNEQGYQTTQALTGQAGFERAIRQLNCELILIHSNCLRWSLSQTVANFRADSRTARTPIAVYGPPEDAAAIRSLQDRYPGISYLPGPLSDINFIDELRRSNVPGPMLTEMARSQLIRQAKAVSRF